MERNWVRHGVNLLSCVLLVLCCILGFRLWRMGAFRSIESLQNCINGFGNQAALLFILLQITQVVVPLLPGGVSCLAGVVLFGPWEGFLYNYLGLTLGSFLAFALARNLGQPLLKRLFSKKLQDKYEKWTKDSRKFDRLFAAAIFLPGFPDDFLCFLAGTTGMRWRTFVIITLACRPVVIALYSLGIIATLPFL